MKEIARVEILDKTCDDCRFELAGCDRRYPNKIECNMLNDRKNWKVEQIPETFEELKELCKDITLDLKICKDGTIYCYEYLLAKNRTPAQMWNIIKNLIG